MMNSRFLRSLLLTSIALSSGVFANTAHAFDAKSVTVRVQSSDGYPVPRAAVNLILASDHWGLFAGDGEPFPTHLGWHNEVDENTDFPTDDSGLLVTPEVSGDYTNPRLQIFIEGLFVMGCGANKTDGLAVFIDPSTGYGINPSQNCPMTYGSDFTDELNCTLSMTKAQLEAMAQRWAKTCNPN